MELKDTIAGMTSPDYRERFKAEYQQTKIRHDKLVGLLVKSDKKELDFTLTCPEEVLRDQVNIMAHYLGLLQIRSEYEGIDLYGVNKV